MAVNGSAPTRESGSAVNTVMGWTGALPWGAFMDDAETTPDLTWPKSVKMYDQMKNDAQCQGLYAGATAAVQRWGWYIDPNECDPAFVELLAADLNLPIGREAAIEAIRAGGVKSARFRNQRRFSWYRHLSLLLRALIYGHMYFEQVGEVTNDGPNRRQVWRLRKLGARHPRTITEIKVARDGGLVSVTQGWGAPNETPPEIPVDKLVAYIWDQEPGNWVGRSMYRSMYRNWLVKDRLLRVDAIKHERNGVGMPIIEGPPGATAAQLKDLDQMAQEYKAGERGGGAVPNGTRVRLVGTEGAIPDTIASIRFHNEEMARSMVMMFMQLGQTETGSRALGSEFIDFFRVAQESLGDWVVDVTGEHVIEDWWDWNVDPAAERVPLLGYVTGQEAQRPDVDAQVEDFQGADLPSNPAASVEDEASLEARRGRARRGRTRSAANGGGGLPAAVEPSAGIRLPRRQLRRQPYAHEIAANADFEGLDDQFEEDLTEAQRSWLDARKEQIANLYAAIGDGGAAVGEVVAAVEQAMTATEVEPREEFLKRVLDLMIAAARRAAAQAQVEARSTAQPPAFDEAKFEQRARAIVEAIWGELNASAKRSVLQYHAATGDREELAQRVSDDLLGRQDVVASDQLKAGIQHAVNQGRMAVFASTDEKPELYASELLDTNTCPACKFIDGQRLTEEQALTLYGGGGYVECDGGPRCRGTVVAVYSDEEIGL
jgi:hypothetical protein